MSKIKCPQCLKSFNKPDNHQGWHHVCLYCHNTFSLLQAPAEEPQPQKAAKPGISAGHMFIAAGLLITLAFFLICDAPEIDRPTNLFISMLLGAFVAVPGYIIYKIRTAVVAIIIKKAPIKQRQRKNSNLISIVLIIASALLIFYMQRREEAKNKAPSPRDQQMEEFIRQAKENYIQSHQ